MSYDSLLIHTCYIGSSTTTTNEFGESKSSWTYSTTATKCRFDPLTLEEKRDIGGDFQNISYRVFFLSGLSATLGGQFKYGDNYYLIRRRHYDSSDHHIECLVEEL